MGERFDRFLDGVFRVKKCPKCGGIVSLRWGDTGTQSPPFGLVRWTGRTGSRRTGSYNSGYDSIDTGEFEYCAACAGREEAAHRLHLEEVVAQAQEKARLHAFYERCQYCGTRRPDPKARFCGKCGRDVLGTPNACPKCRYKFTGATLPYFCPSCGTKVRS